MNAFSKLVFQSISGRISRRISLPLALSMGGAVGSIAVRRVFGFKKVDFRDKVAMITGASRGLGLILARRLLERGARVAICARSVPELEQASEILSRELGTDPIAEHRLLVRAIDLSIQKDCESWVEQVRSLWGRIDVMICNAGIIQVGPEESMSIKDFKDTLDANLWGAIYVSRAATPALIDSKGRLAHITSIGGVISVPHLLPYSVSKFGLVGYSMGLRAELAMKGVAVTTVIPGLMRTGSFFRALFKGNRKDESRWFALSASTPGLSMNAERAAREILGAISRGQAVVTLGLPARAARLISAVAPGLTADALGIVSRFLPKAPASRATLMNEPPREGREELPPESLGPLRRESEATAARNNEGVA